MRLFDADGNEVEVPDGSALRTQLEAERKRAEEAEARIKAAEERAAALLEPAVKAGLSGLPDGAAKAWMLAHPGEVPTQESREAFVTEFGYSPIPPAEPVEPQVQAPEITMQPTDGGESPSGKRLIPKEELTRLMKTDPAKANQAVKDRLVQWNNQEAVDSMLQRQGA